MEIIAGILSLIIWVYAWGEIDEKFGRGASILWFFIGMPICMFTAVWVLSMLGMSGGGNRASGCYQDPYGTYCD
jgi:hypothetical protein